MHFGIVSLFPDLVSTAVQYGVVGRGAEQGLLEVVCENPRAYADDAHRTVDDRPYGGGPGMVMKYAPLAAAIGAAKSSAPAGSPVICLTPQGERFDQSRARDYARLPGLVLVCGRYEGIDERVVDACIDEEVSLGDFVLSGGELAAMAIVDAVARLIPGVLGDEASAANDSFGDGLLDHPHYTRPESIDGRQVPEVLLSGDHERVAVWRRSEALGRTYRRRPDLVDEGLTDDDRKLLEQWLGKRGRIHF